MTHGHEIPREQRELLQRMLVKDECLQWTGAPIPRLFTGGTLSIFFFSLFWLSFVAFWSYGAREHIQMLLFSIPFWLVGIGMFSLPWYNRRVMKNTYYALSDRRAFIVKRTLSGGTDIQNYELERDLVCECRVKSHGRGDLVFKPLPQEAYNRNHDNSGIAFRGFTSVPDVLQVKAAMDKLIEGKVQEEAR